MNRAHDEKISLCDESGPIHQSALAVASYLGFRTLGIFTIILSPYRIKSVRLWAHSPDPESQTYSGARMPFRRSPWISWQTS